MWFHTSVGRNSRAVREFLKEPCFLFFRVERGGLCRFVEDTGHRVVAAVAIFCAWAHSRVVAETVEEPAAHVSRGRRGMLQCRSDEVSVSVENGAGELEPGNR